MARQKPTLESQFRRIPFTGPQYDFIRSLMNKIDVLEKNDKHTLHITRNLITAIQNINNWIHGETKIVHVYPDGTSHVGNAFVAVHIDISLIGELDPAQLDELLSGAWSEIHKEYKKSLT